MSLFHLNYENKTNLIFITAIIWVINFRTSFKNIDSHMDTGCYASVKFDPLVILIKNIFCLIFIAGYIYENKVSKIQYNIETLETLKIENNDDSVNKSQVLYVKTLEEKRGLSFQEATTINLGLDDSKLKWINYVKNFFMILIIYLVEEMYFIFSNNHILDRIIVNMRNFWILIFLLFLSPFIIKKSSYTYRHQLFPSIIILFIALFMILYNAIGIERFHKVFGLNLIAYFGCFFLMGLELTLIKYLLSIKFMSMYLILFLKGVIGSIIFLIINLSCNKHEFFNFLDKILSFEYDDMTDEFPIIQKIGYILSLILIQYLKVFTINTFSQNHILSSMMVSDLIYLPLYIIERFVVQGFNISNMGSFILNSSIGVINVLLMSVFNEILECNFFGLNYNLIKNINERQNRDYIQGSKDFSLEIKDLEDQERLSETSLNDSQVYE